jgi:hypothetical protein
MTFVKALLFPLAVCVALLLSEYEVWCLDDCGIDVSDAAFFSPTVSSSDESLIAVDALNCLLCTVVAPADDDDADDE